MIVDTLHPCLSAARRSISLSWPVTLTFTNCPIGTDLVGVFISDLVYSNCSPCLDGPTFEAPLLRWGHLEDGVPCLTVPPNGIPQS